MDVIIGFADSAVELIAVLVGMLILTVAAWAIPNWRTLWQSWKESRFSRYVLIVERLAFWQLSSMRRSGELENTIENIDELKDRLFDRLEAILESRGLPVELDILNLAIEDAIEQVLFDYFDLDVELSDEETAQ